jgi:AraC-like DNA-binding protein
MTDTLSDVLAVTRLKGTVYFSAELRAPWGVGLPQRSRLPFYVVTRGRCAIRLESAPATSLGSGDLVVLPGGSSHALVSSPTAAAIPLAEFVARHPMDERGYLTALDGTGATTSLIGGFFELERAPEPLVAILPPMIHLAGDDAKVSEWLEPILRAIADEAAQASPGRDVVLNRLADVLFVRVVRAYLLTLTAAGESGPPSWLRGLTDPRIARALGEIHRAPEKDWTLPQLAAGSAMSRTAFARRFRALVGETPVRYLARWRMQKAAYWLEMGTLSITQIAERVGYASELAFAKAFRRVIGSRPAPTRGSGRKAQARR